MAKLGRGAVAYALPCDDSGEMMDQFLERISQPALTDLSFDFHGCNVFDTELGNVPDLFVGRPVVVMGRYSGPDPTRITVSGYDE